MQTTIFVMLLALAVYVGLAALVFYVLYRVVKAAVRDGILEAGKKTGDS